MTITISITQSDSPYSAFNPGSPSYTYGTAPDAAHHKRAEQSDSMSCPANGTSSDDSDFLQKLIEQLLAMLQNSHSDDDNSFDDDGATCGHRSPAPSTDGDDECPCSPHHGHSAADNSQHDGKAPVASGGWGTITDPVTSGGWGTITDPVTSGGSGTITSPASNGDSSTVTHPGSSNSKDASTNSTESADPFSSSGNSKFDSSGVSQTPGTQFYQ
ncbi:hypothetical protein KQH49_09405 [Mycetohabitans sp. B5]|uniref:Uncharacterized protein n=1 Tax=Mycetohabitans endofungorum TaxID=417203 RepID=A0A2P5KBE8_9BURK|nr:MULTISPECIES: hypothetical protein [Mycetohabitans]MCG1055150.1 hypothetical protein [Mycetohabitans sp. B5]PPB84034.1 hypothetical protein B0O95_105218 [Mycetohabitans endofungorum]